MHQAQKVVIVVGPTASGKSDLAVRFAKSLNGEVISADSRQVYKGLNIGTGKITKKEMKGVKHYLLDISSPKKIFTANDFFKNGQKAITTIAKKGKLPIVCGGTGFYIDALLGRIDIASTKPNKTLRKKLLGKSAIELFKLLQKKDMNRAQSMNESDRQNPVRLIRALEVANAKKSLKLVSNKKEFDALWIGILPNKKDLRKKIHTRLLARMKKGMVKEAKKLHKAGLSWERMEELGLEYRYLALYLQKKISREEMLQQLENKIWQYAKRQITYWRRNKNIQWFRSSADAYKALTA
jgi:tRNA dimethylallyltransferase